MSVTNSEIKSLIIEQNKDRIELKENLDELGKKFEKFKIQYDYDMRGDLIPNGHKGLVHEISEIKRVLRESPSLLTLVKEHPFKTITIIFGGIVAGITFWFGLHAFASIPSVEEFLRELFNIPDPVIASFLFGG